MMLLYSLRTKILVLVGGGLFLASTGIAYLAHSGMQDIIDRSQTVVYQGELDHILNTLALYDDELQKTLQVEAYRDQFQEEALRIIKLNFQADSDEDAFPVILDHQGQVLLHPNLAFGDTSATELDFVQTMLNTPAGNFKYHYLGEDKWLIHARFEPWGWVVAYSLRQSYMYADLARFHQALLPGLVAILFVVTAVLFYGLQRFLQPITSLTQSAGTIAAGDLDQRIEVRGRDEVAVLAHNFESMRAAVRQTITNLDSQSQVLKKEVEDRLRAESQALAAEERLRVILHSVADALLVTDLEHQLVMLNPAAQAAFPEAEVTKHLQDIFDDSTLEEALEPIVKGEKDHIRMEWLLQQKGTESRSYNTTSAAIFETGNKRVGVVTLLHDVTKARELDRLKSEFLSTAAHELRTPLAIIQGYSELLCIAPETPERSRREHLETILQRCGELGSLIEDMLDISRLEAGQGLSLHLEEFDLSMIVKQLATQYQDSLKKHQVVAHTPKTPLRVSADLGKIQRILENLLSNASKFSAANSLIEVTCEAKGGLAWVQVKDQGIGISDEKQSRVFDKFYRIDGSNTAPRGLGLGLHIVKNIVEAHGGQVSLESKLGTGTTFTFSLPLAPAS